MSQRDLYQVLGVAREASQADIRAAFIRLAKRHHPDSSHGAELPGRLQEVQHAYHCLSDRETRAAHDRTLDENLRRHFAQQRTVRRHLRRYDERHPHPPLRLRRIHWPSLLVASVGVTLLTWLWLQSAR